MSDLTEAEALLDGVDRNTLSNLGKRKLATSLIQLSIAQSLAQIIKHFEYPMISQGESPPVPGDKL